MNKKAAVGGVGDGRIAETFFRVAGRFHGEIERALGEIGLSAPTFLALKHLVRADAPLPLGELAARTECGKSHMTQVVDRLEAEGLVSRTPDPDDRRSVRAGLTAEGRRRYDAGVRAVGGVEKAFVGRLSGRRRTEFLAALEALLEA